MSAVLPASVVVTDTNHLARKIAVVQKFTAAATPAASTAHVKGQAKIRLPFVDWKLATLRSSQASLVQSSDSPMDVLAAKLFARLPLVQRESDIPGCFASAEREKYQKRLAMLEMADRVRRRIGDAEFRARKPAEEDHAGMMIFASLIVDPVPTLTRPPARASGMAISAEAVIEGTAKLLETFAAVLGEQQQEQQEEEMKAQQAGLPGLTELDSLHRLLGASRKARADAVAAGLDGGHHGGDEDGNGGGDDGGRGLFGGDEGREAASDGYHLGAAAAVASQLTESRAALALAQECLGEEERDDTPLAKAARAYGLPPAPAEEPDSDAEGPPPGTEEHAPQTSTQVQRDIWRSLREDVHEDGHEGDRRDEHGREGHEEGLECYGLGERDGEEHGSAEEARGVVLSAADLFGEEDVHEDGRDGDRRDKHGREEQEGLEGHGFGERDGDEQGSTEEARGVVLSAADLFGDDSD